MIALHAQTQRVPITLLQDLLLLIRDLDQPATAIGLIDTAGIVALGRHLALPAVHVVVTLDEGMEEETGIAVGNLLELERQVEVLVILARAEIAILAVVAVLDLEIAFLVHGPLAAAERLPAGQVLAVEEAHLLPALVGKFLDLDVAEGRGITVVLQADHALVGQAVFGRVRPLAGILELEPLGGPGLELEDLLPVEPMLDVAVVEDDLGRIPLTLRIDMHFGIIRQVHRIIDAQFLPLLELSRSVDFLPALVVDELILGTRDIGDLVGRILHHVIDHAAVAAVGEFPVPGQFEIRILLVGDDVSGAVAAVAGGLDAAIHHLPAVGQFRAVEVTPAAHVLAVEEELPAIRLFCPREAVFLLAGTRESDTNGRN